jgi:hypothetical protein
VPFYIGTFFYFSDNDIITKTERSFFMLILKMIIKYVIISAILFFIGKGMLLKNDEKLDKYKKLSKHIKLPPKVIKNFIGNFIMFSPIIYLSYMVFGVFDPTFYFSIGIVLLFAMVWHIKDVSGKPIDIVLSNFLLSFNNMKKNFFMKFTIIMIISCFCTGIIMIKFVKPLLIKNGITIEEIIIEEQIEEE